MFFDFSDPLTHVDESVVGLYGSSFETGLISTSESLVVQSSPTSKPGRSYPLGRAPSFSLGGPTAFVDVKRKQQWLPSEYFASSSYFKSSYGNTDDGRALLLSSQAYNFFLDLHIPESEINLDIGTVMIKMDLLCRVQYEEMIPTPKASEEKKNGNSNPAAEGSSDAPQAPSALTRAEDIYQQLEAQTQIQPQPISSSSEKTSPANQKTQFKSGYQLIASSSRPLLIPYVSTPVRYLRKLFWAFPLVFGLMTEDQHLTVPLFDDYRDDPSCPLSSVRVSLSANARKFQIYDSKLKIHIQFSGLRYFMFHWFYTTATICIAYIFAVEVFVVLCLGVVLYAHFMSVQHRESGPVTLVSSHHTAIYSPSLPSLQPLDTHAPTYETEGSSSSRSSQKDAPINPSMFSPVSNDGDVPSQHSESASPSASSEQNLSDNDNDTEEEDEKNSLRRRHRNQVL